MTMLRWIRQSVPLATVVLASAAPMALAQWGRQEPRSERELFEWNGSVDREKQIVMRGSQVWTNDVGRTEPRAERARDVLVDAARGWSSGRACRRRTR